MIFLDLLQSATPVSIPMPSFQKHKNVGLCRPTIASWTVRPVYII